MLRDQHLATSLQVAVDGYLGGALNLNIVTKFQCGISLGPSGFVKINNLYYWRLRFLQIGPEQVVHAQPLISPQGAPE